MNKLTTMTTAAIAALALGAALVGCGSDSGTEEATTATTTAEETTSAQAEPEPAPGPTIAEYIQENGITETTMHHGDPGPVINLPAPEGWKILKESPQAPYGGIVYSHPADPNEPASIVATLSKLTGNVDPAKILELAPNEVMKLPGYESLGGATKSELGGFEAVQVGATYEGRGKRRMAAQKTVVIPAADGLYMLQLNASSLESDAEALMQAAGVIDKETTITP